MCKAQGAGALMIRSVAVGYNVGLLCRRTDWLTIAAMNTSEIGSGNNYDRQYAGDL